MSERLFKDDTIFLQRLLKSSELYTGRIDGSWGPKTDAAVTAFENQSIVLADRLGIFDPRTERNMLTLHLKAQEIARIFMNTILDEGINSNKAGGVIRLQS